MTAYATPDEVLARLRMGTDDRDAAYVGLCTDRSEEHTSELQSP